jgi:hypothetical protein
MNVEYPRLKIISYIDERRVPTGYSTFIYIWYYLQTWVLYVHLYMILSSDVGTLRSSIYENTERYYIASSETTYTCNRNIAIYSKRYITMSDIKQYTMWMLHPHPLPPKQHVNAYLWTTDIIHQSRISELSTSQHA